MITTGVKPSHDCQNAKALGNNEKITAAGLIAFGGHPDQDFQIQGIYTRQEPYLNFTVQFQQPLKDASDLLLRTTSY